jgi:RimJ/RimL family protein N-acetyltransferase
MISAVDPQILETDRLILRELDSDSDAEFIFELLNTPKFIKYIGDRGVRSREQACDFIDNRYRASYRDHGYGLYLTVQKTDSTAVGICGFVKRDYLEHADIGFAFLPQFEQLGFGFESAAAMLRYGREKLNFERVFAITSQDNDVSGKLLTKLGFDLSSDFTTPEGEQLKLYEIQL